ncbi:oligopeptidase A [Thrips palmi]|uniref:Oligopeptidase A n=1 Tax=Thrips palmi TaxID=161013 RepID=A0A6P8Y930_THRPL|nr:oligopeptidase A [Thrips palmi]
MALSLTCRRLLYRQHPTFLQCRQSGYIVMLPDVPLHSDDNSLLRSDAFQDFSSLTGRKCYDGVVRRSLDFQSSFWKIEKHIKDKKGITDVELFQEYLCPIEEVSRPLDNAYNTVKILHQATDLLSNEKYNKIASRAAVALENKFTSPLLYHSCKNALESNETNLPPDQKRLLAKYTLFGKLNGMELPTTKYDSLVEARKGTLRYQNTYNGKLAHETRQYKLPISDSHMLKNFPERLLRAMSEGPDPSRGPWTLRYRTMTPFLEYCPDALLRNKVWLSSATFGLHEEMTALNVDVTNIRYARKQEAKILGFNSYAEYAMESKMAGSVDDVLGVLDHLLQKARPAQAHEIESLNKFAFENGYHKPLEFCDVPYWQRAKLNKAYGFNENELSAYFPFETVLSGLFTLLNDMFGIEMNEIRGVDVWARDVRVYEVLDSKSKAPIAHLYLDPFMRSEKSYSNGVALTLRNRSLVGKEQTPQIGIMFSFSPPAHGKPSLLSFNNVVDLFGRFGYALQVILSKAAYAEVAGSAFVEVDAAEIPSHFLEHWAYTPAVVKSISGHYDNGDKLPDGILNNLDRVKKHMAGFHLCNEIYKSRLDMELFATDIAWKTVMEKLWPMYSAFPLDPMDHSPLSFHEIFNEGSASYYSHIWSRLIAADIFTAFEEVGLENKESIRTVGDRFRDTYLNGLSGAAKNFRKFRGRDPAPDAFLLSLGLQKPLKPTQSK